MMKPVRYYVLETIYKLLLVLSHIFIVILGKGDMLNDMSM